MKKLTLMAVLAIVTSSIDTLANDDHKFKKKPADEKCVKGSDCCKKGTNKAAMMKAAKRVVKAGAKKA